jgi:hypothetical protein
LGSTTKNYQHHNQISPHRKNKMAHTVHVVNRHTISNEGWMIGFRTWHLGAYDASGREIYKITESCGNGAQGNVDKTKIFVENLAAKGYILTLDQANDICGQMSEGKAKRSTESDLNEITGNCAREVRPGNSFQCSYTARDIVDRAKDKARPGVRSIGCSL